MSRTSPELDASQQEAVDVDPSDRQIVIAGPGSGKTEVVAALVARLVEEQELDPTTGELVVISFSRAAVHAVTRRLRQVDAPASAALRTLDSLAAQIASEALDDDVGRMSFDARVRRATAALRDGSWGAVDDIAHLVVDEVQDVVGVRADFLLLLLECLGEDAGFTLLGDPAQAIYDFQLTAADSMTSKEMLSRAAALPRVETRRLTGSYRAWTRDASAAVALRDGAAPGLEDVGADVRDFLEGLVPVDDEDLPALLTIPGQSAAILTATNGQALLEADALWEQGVPALVRRPMRDPVVDRWVAELLAGRATWTRDEILAAHGGDDVLASARWRALRTIATPRGRMIDTSAVASGIAARPLPPELVASDADVPVVSTVHRAKGLEFCTVVVARYPERATNDVENGADVRAGYVAVTRARARLARLERAHPWGLSRHAGTGRWIRTWREKWKIRQVEVRGSDLDRTEPPGEGVEAVQEHLRTSVHVADPLTLELDWARSLDVPIWTVLHEGLPIGRTSSEFGADFARIVRSQSWPRLAGVRVETVETVAGPRQVGRADDVGRHGLW